MEDPVYTEWKATYARFPGVARCLELLGDRKTKLAWTWERGTAKVLEARGLESAPGVVIYDPGEKDELKLVGKLTLKEGDDPKLLNQGIDDILKDAK